MLVGGGSGGHFYPLMAVAEAIRARETEVSSQVDLYYIGPAVFDQPALGKLGIEYVKCPAGKVRRYAAVQNFIDPFITAWGFVVALTKMFWIYPDVLFSKGSFTSVPVVLAAWILQIPIVIHESDAVPGRATKFGAKFAKYIGVTYKQTAQLFPEHKTALVGAPIRKSFYAEPNPQLLRELQIDPNENYILFLTGSLGAERLNHAILSSLDELLPHFKVIHQAGAKHVATVTDTADALITDKDLRVRYHPVGNVSAAHIHAFMSFAGIVVSRAGSGTISEIAFHQKPAILVPIPEEVSHDQRKNAYAYARTGGASVVEEHNLTDNLLVAEITRILQDTDTMATMRRGAESFFIHHASFAIADQLIKIAREHAD